MDKKVVELKGIILSCSVGYNAIIILDDGELVTSPVEKINMIWQNKIYFETQNTNYIISGALVTL